MKLHELKAAPESRKKKIRRGRGDASGHGSFCGRGCKGQNSRAGGGVRLGFEGGQIEFLKRMPKKKGFKNPNRVVFQPINFDLLEKSFPQGGKIDPEILIEKGIAKKNRPVKILGRGKISAKFEFSGLKLSKSVENKLKKSKKTTENKTSTKETKEKSKSEKTEKKD